MTDSNNIFALFGDDKSQIESNKERSEDVERVRALLKEEVATKSFVYIGPGAENKFETSILRLRTAAAFLRVEEDYTIHHLQVERPNVDDPDMIRIRVLASPGVTHQEIWRNRDRITKLWLDAQPNGKN
jgi:hypothetical protein